jgi:hypothetical protein
VGSSRCLRLVGTLSTGQLAHLRVGGGRCLAVLRERVLHAIINRIRNFIIPGHDFFSCKHVDLVFTGNLVLQNVLMLFGAQHLQFGLPEPDVLCLLVGRGGCGFLLTVQGAEATDAHMRLVPALTTLRLRSFNLLKYS